MFCKFMTCKTKVIHIKAGGGGNFTLFFVFFFCDLGRFWFFWWHFLIFAKNSNFFSEISYLYYNTSNFTVPFYI